MAPKSTHLIDKYSVAQHRIVCACQWEGHEDDFRKHQLESPPTDRVVTSDYESTFQPRLKMTIDAIIKKEYV